MSLPLFSTWSRIEVLEAIKALEEGIALGAVSIQYPNAGGIQQVSRSEATLTLRALYRRLDEIDGKQTSERHGGIRFIRTIVRTGY